MNNSDHIKTLKKQYLEEYLVPDYQAHKYIWRNIYQELICYDPIDSLRKRFENYSSLMYDTCELCQHYEDFGNICRNSECSLYQKERKLWDDWYNKTRKLSDIIHDTIKPRHIELYILIKVAQRKLAKYKQQLKSKGNETS